MTMYDGYHDRLVNVKQQLDEVSPSFCIAKWKQVTMHLQNGHTHSCHHPKTHFIPVEEIKRNPTALHNTEFKKQQRKMMLRGERPPECDYCWRVEDKAEDSFSDRVYKSADSWALPHIQDIVDRPWDDDTNPSYVEVSFGNVCNFKCSYCAPQFSSQWMEEVEKHGPFPTSDRFNNLDWLRSERAMPIPVREENPYVDAFWEWWPSMYKDLEHFRITGGEPMLNKNTFRVLDYIIENPNPNLSFSINSNMNPPDDLFEKFLEKIKIIVNEGKVKQFKMFTSAEAHGRQSEYIRTGMNYDRWLDNLHRVYATIPNFEFTIMSTYNILSVTTYIEFMQDILEIKRRYGRHDSWRNPCLLDIPYLRYPPHQAIFIAEPQMVEMVQAQVDFMYSNLENPSDHSSNGRGFYEHEADKLKRILEVVKNTRSNSDTEQHRKNFVRYVDEHDRRRVTDFADTFPELVPFYNKWKNTI